MNDERGGARLAAGLGAIGRHDVSSSVPKVETGIAGLDDLTLGGLPAGRLTLVTGPAGSGKTVLSAQFLAEGVVRGQNGVFVTFEEPADDLRQNLRALGWDVPAWEAQEQWWFVDASPIGGPDEPGFDYDFEALYARIAHAVDRTAADRIVLDSISAAMSPAPDPAAVRVQLRRLAMELRRLHLTVVMTVESDLGDRQISPYGFEEFLADNVIVLRNTMHEEKRRRTLEVLKMRGAMHRKGEYTFTVLPGQGVVVIPLSVVDLSQRSTDTRITSGNKAVDELCGGGMFQDSVVLVSGATGAGKTLMVTEFVAGAAQEGQRALLFAFEESREQISRNALNWGHDFAPLEKQGVLRVVANYPEVASLEDHLIEITREIERFRPDRIAIDSLTALARSGSEQAFREFLIVLTSYVKAEQITALFTSTSPALFGGHSVTDTHVSTLTDSIILLRYVEIDGAIRRGIAVLKMRGSPHDLRIHEFTIDSQGLKIGEPFRGIAGILAGQSAPVSDPRGERSTV